MHNVRYHRTGVKRLHHPIVGDLELTYEALELPADAGLTMSTYTAEPGRRPPMRSCCWRVGRRPPSCLRRTRRQRPPGRDGAPTVTAGQRPWLAHRHGS
ncbi:MmyB family transcriptional regulator [Humibacter ginsengisoli]